MSDSTPTPRTDALVQADWLMPRGWKQRIHDHARALERECAEAKHAAEVWATHCDCLRAEMGELQAIVFALRAELAKCRKDAERYRYVRAHVSRIFNEETLMLDGLRVEAYYDEPQPFLIRGEKTDERFDAAIDAALSSAGEGEKK